MGTPIMKGHPIRWSMLSANKGREVGIQDQGRKIAVVSGQIGTFETIFRGGDSQAQFYLGAAPARAAQGADARESARTCVGAPGSHNEHRCFCEPLRGQCRSWA
jgi:hypothetical protein